MHCATLRPTRTSQNTNYTAVGSCDNRATGVAGMCFSGKEVYVAQFSVSAFFCLRRNRAREPHNPFPSVRETIKAAIFPDFYLSILGGKLQIRQFPIRFDLNERQIQIRFDVDDLIRELTLESSCDSNIGHEIFLCYL